MCPSLRTAAAAVVLVLAASEARAQYWYPPGYKPKTVVVNIPYGPFGSLSLPATVFQRTPVPPGAFVPPWYYGPIVPVPVPVPTQQPPIIIQNNVAPPAAAAENVPGNPAFPNEFDPKQPKVAGKNPPKNGRAAAKGPAAKPDVGVAIPNPPKAAPKVAGVADADRASDAGKKAFADGQYGRALELFRRTVAINPQDSSAHFNVAQAAFALGKYRDAVDEIKAGIALRPDWADARFVVRDLYFKKSDVFDDHLKALRQALAAFPEDPTLLFLLGHQLWFDNKVAEAKPLLQKALDLGKDRTPAGSFR